MRIFTLLKLLLAIVYTAMLPAVQFHASAQEFVYTDSWSSQGFSFEERRNNEIIISYSIHEFELRDLNVNGETMKTISLPGHFLPNNEGAPNLPGSGRYIAIPNGADVQMEIIDSRKQSFTNIEIAPAFRIPKDSENQPPEYKKDPKIYHRNAFYPAKPVQVSEPTQIRGIDVCMLGITPWQYNPVSKELIVYRDLKVKLTLKGGDGKIGDDRLRNRWWDPLIKDVVLNSQDIQKIDYNDDINGRHENYGAEYVIIVPNDTDFIYWADSLKRFRIQQGISTRVVTTEEIGGNNAIVIENWINDAYATWDVPPAAILLVGDYGTSGNTVVSPYYDNYCVSDHIYADVNNNDMADIVIARITARDASELQIMFGKIFSYETNPPVNPGFYQHPITALGWQSDRWFQICSEAVGGFFRNQHAKDPVRINAVYEGDPNLDPWSSNVNTHMVTDYFGPDGTGYIPASPQELGGWSGGSASDVTNAINSGAFLLQHRDHGNEFSWGEPNFNSSDIANLDNDDPVFVFSINCLTGKYNLNAECFTEVFHRHPKGALGLIAASETSYSFVNDTYVWGLFDNLWPDFMPDVNTDPLPRGLYPSFGNVAGKYFLQQSNWPFNANSKEVTYHLFHHHGGAFSTLYSEVPQPLTVLHDDFLLAGVQSFTITADEGSLIALTVGEEIIGLAEGTGNPVDVSILPQLPPAVVNVTVTKTNHYRYSETLQVIPPDGPYVVRDSFSFTDENGNNQVDNGENISLSLAMKNVGIEYAENVDVSLSTDDPYTTVIDQHENYGAINPQEVVNKEDAFTIKIADSIPNQHAILFDVAATDGMDTWESKVFLKANAPVLEYVSFEINEVNGNNNNLVDPGETVELKAILKNKGSTAAYDVSGEIHCSDIFVDILAENAFIEEIQPGISVQQVFQFRAHDLTPQGFEASILANFTAGSGHKTSGDIRFHIGKIPVLVLNLDKNHNSGTEIRDLLESKEIPHIYSEHADQNLINNYKSIFVCLGVYPDNYVLTNPEGQALKHFLDEGGKLYMEGGDTWYYDDPTEVHPYFNISSTNDGESDMRQLQGQDGTFTEGLSYDYDGDNNWMDQLSALNSAKLIFKNQSPEYGAAVMYDGGQYRTIGASFEFGGLTDAQFTKEELLVKYLEFFGFGTRPQQTPTPSGSETVCSNEMGVTYSTSRVDYAEYYEWILSPAEAGEIVGLDTSIYINWDAAYEGNAALKVRGMGVMGAGEYSQSLQIYVHQAPSGFLMGSDTTICFYDTLICSAATGFTEYLWADSSNGMNMIVDSSGVGMEGFKEIWLRVTDFNGCSATEYSSVEFTGCAGTNEIYAPQIRIYPNPSTGAFTIESDMGWEEEFNLRIVDVFGKPVYREKSFKLSAGENTLDLPEIKNGVYFLIIENQEIQQNRKIIINK